MDFQLPVLLIFFAFVLSIDSRCFYFFCLMLLLSITSLPHAGCCLKGNTNKHTLKPQKKNSQILNKIVGNFDFSKCNNFQRLLNYLNLGLNSPEFWSVLIHLYVRRFSLRGMKIIFFSYFIHWLCLKIHFSFYIKSSVEHHRL